ncbi:zeaxanthin epoxidase, chloroplastic-like [Melia azedarach]|uniref:Zeaxanthin epoxidase, chloroplastic-like n=1 Tax=Melia azedarach TaxID=155640 RepID=A0ACC1X9E1_MELAZ|nr:zeaxanthin epoxidase, chloroplastic-like [Melia azedarach]
MSVKKQRLKAIIVGGSIGGVSCAKALILAGWDVLVIEKSLAPPTLSPTGAGLALDPLARKIVASWIHQPEPFQKLTLPLTIFQNQVTDGAKKVNSVLTRDENFNCVIAYWADLHGLLYNELPPEIFLWGHQFLSFCISEDKSTVKVKAKVLQTEEIVEIEGDLLVAADGGRSSIRHSFLHDTKLRYAGYCAWRGVLDFSENLNSETIQGIRKAYPDLGKCVYTDLGPGTHSLLDELPYKRVNWIWFVNQLEPELKGDSATMKVGSDMIRMMHQEAEKVWIPELAKVIKETEEPFLNVIHDCDPLPQISWNNVVLIGDAAHPTTPHCARSTNMAIIDAAVLGKCLEKWGPENLNSALEEYQAIRLPVTSMQVLHSRKVGRIKQGLNLPDREPFDQKRASPEECEFFLSKNMPFVIDVPRILDSMFQI